MPWYIKLDPVNDGDKKRYFSGWIKHRPDMPEAMRQILDRAGCKVGESTPMFTEDFTGMLTFDDEGMAQHTANRIAGCVPDFDGHLFVKRLIGYNPSDEGA